MPISRLACALPLVVALFGTTACDKLTGASVVSDAGPSASAAAVIPAASSAPPAASSAAAADTKPGEVPGKYAYLSKRLMKEEDFGAGAGLSCEDANIMRNEIYARHGLKFKTKKLADYFAKQAWYKPEHDNVDKMLTDVEKQNVEKIKAYEKNVCK